MKTTQSAIKYGAVLIGVFLAVAYGSSTSNIVRSGGRSISNVVKALQGR